MNVKEHIHELNLHTYMYVTGAIEGLCDFGQRRVNVLFVPLDDV
jgi:hypothetical protein